MVLKFEEYINEGLWSSGMKRAETNSKREEDVSEFERYLRDVEWVDLGHPDFLFAKKDFRPVLHDEIKLIDTELLPDNIGIITLEAYQEICKNCNTIKENNKYKYISDKTNEYIIFEDDASYFWENVLVFQNGAKVKVFDLDDKTDKVKLCNKKSYFRIKLIKKKDVNEGLWSSGMKRAETGEERLENSFWNGEEMFKVEGFKDYYFSPDPEGFFIDVYHKPNKEPLISFKDLDYKPNYFYIGGFSEIELTNNPTPEEKKTVTSEDFKKAINKSIKSEVPSDYYNDDMLL